MNLIIFLFNMERLVLFIFKYIDYRPIWKDLRLWYQYCLYSCSRSRPYIMVPILFIFLFYIHFYYGINIVYILVLYPFLLWYQYCLYSCSRSISTFIYLLFLSAFFWTSFSFHLIRLRGMIFISLLPRKMVF
jgi:hypothetical protein